jgi:cytochrome c553
MKHALLIAGLITSFGLASSALAGGDVQAGKAKAGPCAACHGPNGEGKAQNPPLAGKAEAQLVQAMKDYKSGKRANAVMKTLAAPLSEQDMANLAAYYASLKGK